MSAPLIRLADLPPGVARPRYDRAAHGMGILHLGLGAFHRAHQAVHTDDALAAEGGDWRILGANLRSREIPEALNAQDGLFTVLERSDSDRARVIGAHGPAIGGDAAAILRAACDPAIRILSLTVSEKAYGIDRAAMDADPAHPAVAADLAQPQAPQGVLGIITAALAARREAGVAPFTVLSCDNLPDNGALLRAGVLGFARRRDPGLAGWIADHVAFPATMVDRITPATSDRERRMVREDFGIHDDAPVFCEDFIQWVLEDNFPAGRPPLEKAGVEFVADVTPWELMKIRILNGGHAVIAYPAGLLDIHFVHEAMADAQVRAFLGKVEADEIIPAVPPVPGTDLQAYFAKVAERCANPKIGDTVRRLCLDGSNRQPKFIVPTIAHRRERGLPVDGLALESALWCRYCAGTSDSGAVIEPNDPNWDHLTQVAQAARTDPSAWLDMAEIYGATGRDPRFAEPFARWLAMLWDRGTRATLDAYLKG